MGQGATRNAGEGLLAVAGEVTHMVGPTPIRHG